MNANWMMKKAKSRRFYSNVKARGIFLSHAFKFLAAFYLKQPS